MTQGKNHHHSALTRTTAILLLTLVGLYFVTMTDAAKDISQELESISSEESLTKDGPLLKFLLRPVDSSSSDSSGSSSMDKSHTDNNAVKRIKLNIQTKDNDDHNNDSKVLSNSGEEHRFRRDDLGVKAPGAQSGKVITTNWGTYEEQQPVVLHSGSRAIDTASTSSSEEEPTFSDIYNPRNHDESNEFADGGQPYGESSISYEDYEAGRFEGRQFYPSRGGDGYDSNEDGYYRRRYYATTTTKPLNQQRDPVRGGQQSSQMEQGNRPHPNREEYYPQYRHPQRKEDEPISGVLNFFQKAKNLYDIFRAMNGAWQTIEDSYRKKGEAIFPDDLKTMNDSTREALLEPYGSEIPPSLRKKQSHPKRLKPTQPPVTSTTDERSTTNENDESRLRRSSAEHIVNDWEGFTPLLTTPTPQTAEDSDSSLESDSDLSQSEPEAESKSEISSSTDLAEGRYIKGDPLKGYYDFVITEGSYKFWAAFQVGTAILIIYSTFAAIYYSKVNPLVSDYDYIDYLGGARSLSDDSDFVDTDTASGGGPAATDGTGSKAVKSQQRQQSSAGWFDWLPHAGHSLRFILESIDKQYTEEK